ncbi:MAG TPA: hypothetical protein VIY90_14090 [Steroidobacteraceae bacterium]
MPHAQAEDRSDPRLWRQTGRTAPRILDPKAQLQITQLLDTFIEREKFKQRIDAQEAREAGLLTSKALAQLLDAALRRQRAADALLSIADRVAAAGIPPMSMEEVNADGLLRLSLRQSSFLRTNLPK